MIEIKNLKKTYKLGKQNEVYALRDIDVEIPTGQVSAIVGPSGSGKSTLLNILGGLDFSYIGEILVEGKDVKSYNKNYYRRYIVQTIFQQFYLVPSLSVFENTILPVKFGNQLKGKELENRAKEILNEVGLWDRRDHKPNELSGGQIQRVAIARALITNPKIILADEPTGNLDTKTGASIVELLFKVNEKEKNTMIIITHDMDIIEDVKTKIFIKDGLIEKVTK